MKNKYKYLLFLPLIGVCLLLFAKNNSSFAEFYALHIYKIISVFFSKITSLIPFSLAELSVICAVVLLTIFLVYTVIKVIKSKERRLKVLVKQISIFASVFSLILFLFITNCGLNYYRTPFAESIQLNVQNSQVSELKAVCIKLANLANSYRVNLKENEDGIFESEYTFSQLREISSTSFSNASLKYTTLSDKYSSVKEVFWGKALSYMNTTGIYFPFTFEANVNTHITDYKIPFTICHETAHLQGYMKEDEANFIAFLACINSDDIEFKYSGVIEAFVYTSNSLYKEDQKAYFDIFNYLCDGIKRDLAYNSEYIEEHSGTISQSAAVINDVYLRVNNSSDGIKSYGKMVDLLLAYYK